MKNHWLEEKKKFIKIYDNTRNTKTVFNPSVFTSDQREKQFFTKVPKGNMPLKNEIDDHFWFDRLNRQLFYWNNKEIAKSIYPTHWSLPTQPGQ